MRRTVPLALAAFVAAFAIVPAASIEAAAAAPTLATTTVVTPMAVKASTFKNCTKLNKVYPHGVGKKGAKDKTSGTPVTNFKHSTALYKKAMKHNKGLDRDKDGIACEKA
ncbi:MAG: excalibur calcium-binding domain-containing protein [Propionicimonas sp.]|uniref:excalibur calcium-binding domain-containing protein n=1 Tax=Propionicimonas sp. TaxID=1955623 RepID=UPI003D09A5A9